jgi:hypothetical protein
LCGRVFSSTMATVQVALQFGKAPFQRAQAST